MTFTTHTGSVYHIDGNRVRRGADARWRQFDYASPVVTGKGVVFQWDDGSCTVTSRVTEVER